jgi:hypothetical protein
LGLQVSADGADGVLPGFFLFFGGGAQGLEIDRGLPWLDRRFSGLGFGGKEFGGSEKEHGV